MSLAIEDDAQGIVLAGFPAGSASHEMQKIAAKGLSETEQNEIEYLKKLIKANDSAAYWAQA